MVKNRIICTLICMILVLNVTGCNNKTAEFLSSEETYLDSGMETESEAAESEEIQPEEPRSIYVYVCGQVADPGVYAIPEGSRICDLFRVAGGLTEQAAGDYWNQARILTDGEMIYVPTEEEAKERTQEERESAASSGAAQDTSSDNNKKINLNTASKEELMTLPGIGESKALAILSYRKEKGRFLSIEDLKEIPGIKDGVLSKIKDYITIN